MTDLPALAYVGVGSNINPEENIRKALSALGRTEDLVLSGISTFYRTAPIADPTNSILPPGQNPESFDPDFLNGVLEIRTRLSPDQIMGLFSEIEEHLGRERRGNRFAPRTIDLDLLLYGSGNAGTTSPVWEEIGPERYLAHADIEKRAFVSHPLLELAPDLALPPYGTPLRAITASFESPGGAPETEFTAGLRARFLSA